MRTIDFAGRPEATGDRDAQSTDIEAAINLALNRASTTSRAAIVVVSDGNATGGDTRRALQLAADAGVPLLWRIVEPNAQSPHIARVLAAAEASPGQEIPVSLQLSGKIARPMLVELSSRDGRVEPVDARVAPGTPGLLSLPVRAVSAGTLVLDATLRDEDSSHIVDAWQDAVAIDVAAPAEILFVAAGPSVLARSLRDGGWTVSRALPPGGAKEKLAEQVARIASRPLDRSRPLWELYLVHGLEDGHKALLTKIHHALIDGLSGAEIMGVLFDLAPEGRELPEPEHERQRAEADRAGDAHPRADGRAAVSAADAALAASRASQPRRVAGLRRHPWDEAGRQGHRPAHQADLEPARPGSSLTRPTRRRRPASTGGSRPTAGSPSASSRWTR